MVSIGKVFSFFGRNAKKAMPIAEGATKVPFRTKVMTDIDTGIIRMEREFSKNGDTFLARVERQPLPNGGEKTTTKIFGAKPEGGYYFGQGDEGVRAFREKEVVRNTKGSILGGDRVQINKNYHETMSSTAHYDNLTKDYNPQGVLEHKELTHKYRHWDKPKNAVQDRVYEEYPLNHSIPEMLENPGTHTNYKHKLDGSSNYYHFSSPDTRYSKAVAAKEQAAIDAAKKAEAEAIAAKEAAEKAAAELKAKQPRINISKALNRDINDLVAKETKLADGTIECTFSDPVSGEILAKTRNKGILHQEWIYGGKADMIYMKQAGKDKPYILSKKGNYTQLEYIDSKNNPFQDHTLRQYYDDGNTRLERSYQFGSNPRLYTTQGQIKVFDKTAAERQKAAPSLNTPNYSTVHIYQNDVTRDAVEDLYPYASLSYAKDMAREKLRELNKEAQDNFVNLQDLFSEYKA